MNLPSMAESVYLSSNISFTLGFPDTSYTSMLAAPVKLVFLVHAVVSAFMLANILARAIAVMSPAKEK